MERLMTAASAGGGKTTEKSKKPPSSSSSSCRRRQAGSENNKRTTSLVCLAAAVAGASQSSTVEVAAASASSVHHLTGCSRGRTDEWQDVALHSVQPSSCRAERQRQLSLSGLLQLRGGDAQDGSTEGGGADSSSRNNSHEKSRPDDALPTKPRRRRSSKDRQGKEDENLSWNTKSTNPPRNAGPSMTGSASSDTSKEDDRSAKGSSPSSAPRGGKSGHSHSSRIVQEILKADDYYEILGLSKHQVRDSADPLHMVTKAYRRRCVHTHPDKTGGDRSAFDKVAEAYHVLSDETQRHIYDRHGKRGLQQHQQMGGGGGGGGGFGFGAGQGLSAEDLFRSFFEGSMGGAGSGGGGFFRSQQQRQAPVRRNRTTRYQLEVTLSDLYKGISRSIRIAPPSPSPFFRTAHDNDGESKVVNVTVPRGTLEGSAIVLSGEIDFDRDAPPADLVLIVKQVPHPVFQRKNYDLITTVKLPLSEALGGFSSLSIPHLSGETLVVSYGADENDNGEFRAIRSGDVHVLKGHGMPKDESGRHFGDLYVVYQVEMPPSQSESSRRRKSPMGGRSALSKDERRELKRLLSKLEGRDARTTSSGAEDKAGPANALPLQRANPADVGRASGQPPPPTSADPHLVDDDHESNGPFGSRFFFSSNSGATGGSGPSFFGMPGFDPPDMGDADGVQCRQM